MDEIVWGYSSLVLSNYRISVIRLSHLWLLCGSALCLRTDYVSLGLRTLKNHQQHKKLWKQQLTDNEQPLEVWPRAPCHGNSAKSSVKDNALISAKNALGLLTWSQD
eukprot:98520-Amphidinium_carterae.1